MSQRIYVENGGEAQWIELSEAAWKAVTERAWNQDMTEAFKEFLEDAEDVGNEEQMSEYFENDEEGDE